MTYRFDNADRCEHAPGRPQSLISCLCALFLILATPTRALPQAFTVLHAFSGQPDDGEQPLAGVVLDAYGSLYGTTISGGRDDVGVVFELTNSGTETVLYSFSLSGGDAGSPQAALLLDAKGNLYGTSLNGGQNQVGAIF